MISIPASRLRHGAVLAVLPFVFYATVVTVRTLGGPYWVWHIIDPSYYYLFDSLNLAGLTWPGHVFHPGATVHALGAIVLKAAHPLMSNSERVVAVLDDPERYLRLIGSVIVFLQAIGLLIVGAVALEVTKSRVLALLMQTAPFLTMVVFKNTYHVKPEAVLVMVMLAFSVTALLALRPGALDRNGITRFAIAWGVIAGFGVATKLTAAPVFLAPLFLLGNFRHIAVYGVVSLVSLLVFALPVAGNLHQFFSFATAVVQHSGAYGSGAATIIDISAYPNDVLKILKRPAAGAPVILALVVLVVSIRRRMVSQRVPLTEVRLLVGIGFAIVAHALAVAKQPTANYMVPSYMLLPLAVVLTWRFAAAISMQTEKARKIAAMIMPFALVALLGTSGARISQQADELLRFRQHALSEDDPKFDKCAKVFFFPASRPSFALFMGDWWTGSQYAREIASRVPADEFWYEHNTNQLRDAYGQRDLKDLAENYPCLMFRGGHRGKMSGYIAKMLPNQSFHMTCSTPEETIFTNAPACEAGTR